MSFREFVQDFLTVHPGLEAPHSFENQGNGVLATTDISPNSLLVSIPKSHLFSTYTVQAHDRLGRIVSNSFTLSPITPLTAMETLILGLIYFKANPQESTFWTSYIATIPQSFDSLIFWTMDELGCLGSQHLVSRLERRKSKIARLYEHLSLVLQKSIDTTSTQESSLCQELTLESFTWAYAAVMSRSVFVDGNSLSKSPLRLYKNNAALPPFLDFFNHVNDTTCTAGFSTKSQCYELRTEGAWKSGDQVFIKYGNHPNTTLLIHYGFVIENNPYDSILLDWNFEALIAQSELSEAKLTKLQQFGLLGASGAPKAKTKHELNLEGLGWNTMVTIKTLMIKTDAEMAKWDNLLEDVQISDENEASYRQFALEKYQSLLSELSTVEKPGNPQQFTLAQMSPYRRYLVETFRSGTRILLEKAVKDMNTENIAIGPE